MSNSCLRFGNRKPGADRLEQKLHVSQVRTAKSWNSGSSVPHLLLVPDQDPSQRGWMQLLLLSLTIREISRSCATTVCIRSGEASARSSLERANLREKEEEAYSKFSKSFTKPSFPFA